MNARGVVVVGEDNPLSNEPEYALYNYPEGCSGWRLQRIFGLDDDQYLALARTNLCSPMWSAIAARERAAALVAVGSPHRVFVLLGAKVRATFGKILARSLGEFELVKVGEDGLFDKAVGQREFWFVCLPHPSGRCQAWNRPGAKELARGLLRLAAPDVPWGTA